jgi:hypothetical protein
MTMLGEARASVAAALRDDPALSGVTIYDSPPAVITAPAVVVAATADPWVAVRTITKYDVSFNLVVAVAQGAGSASNYDALEEIVVEVLRIFPQATSVGSVTVTSSGQSDLVQVSIPVAVQVTEG